MSWTIILVPHDFSTSAHHATAIARDEAKLHGGTLVLLHVIELPHQLSPDAMIIAEATGAPISVKQYAIDSAQAHLQELADRLATDGVTARGVIRLGAPVDEINRAVDTERADLIVMGTHGRTGFRHLVAGSVAERVVRSSKVPVLTIRDPGPG